MVDYDTMNRLKAELRDSITGEYGEEKLIEIRERILHELYARSGLNLNGVSVPDLVLLYDLLFGGKG